VLVFDDAAFGAYATEAYARALAQAIADAKPSVVLVPFTAMGKDLAPRVAARVGAGLASDCVGLSAPGGKLVARRPLYAGKAYATVEWAGEPQMATLRTNVFPLGTPDPSRKAEVVKGSCDTSSRAKVAAVRTTAQGKVQLTEAQIIVSGGRGLGGPQGFELLQELAQALGAALGSSRAGVDEGWIPYSHQVGQTGKTVCPKVYIACGISGAVQHLVGMQSSDVIIAINKNPEAPIFNVATFGIVGDLYEVVPLLVRRLKEVRGVGASREE
jgi:electron transfer flavoprotein alpha subunit